MLVPPTAKVLPPLFVSSVKYALSVLDFASEPLPIATESFCSDFAPCPNAIAFSLVAFELLPIAIAFFSVLVAIFPKAIPFSFSTFAFSPIAMPNFPIALALSPIATAVSPDTTFPPIPTE